MSTDDRTGSGVILDYSQERIHKGKSYIATFKTPDASPVADNANLDFLIITGATAIDFIFGAGGNGDIEIQFYEETVVSNNGTQVPVVGLNRQRSFAQTPVVWRGPTITTIGNLLYNDIRTYGVEPAFSHGLEWILKPNTKYLIRAINRQGQVQPIYIMAQWDEYP